MPVNCVHTHLHVYLSVLLFPLMFIWACESVSTCLHACVRIYLSVWYTCQHMSISVCICDCVDTWKHVYVCKFIGVCLNVCVPYVSIHACECVHVWLHAAHQHICVYVWLCVSALYVSAHDFWVHVCVYTTGWMSGYCECLGTSVFPVRILTEFTYFFLWRVLEDWCEFTLARSLREVEYYTPWYSRNIHSVRLLYLCVMWPFLGRCQ